MAGNSLGTIKINSLKEMRPTVTIVMTRPLQRRLLAVRVLLLIATAIVQFAGWVGKFGSMSLVVTERPKDGSTDGI